MHGLPPNLDLRFFSGRTLIQICVGENDCGLNFDDGLSIIITSAIGHFDPDAGYKKFLYFPDAVGRVGVLLGKRVFSATGSPDGTLTLHFPSKARLEMFDDSKQYESYVITHKGRVIVV